MKERRSSIVDLKIQTLDNRVTLVERSVSQIPELATDMNWNKKLNWLIVAILIAQIIGKFFGI